MASTWRQVLDLQNLIGCSGQRVITDLELECLYGYRNLKAIREDVWTVPSSCLSAGLTHPDESSHAGAKNKAETGTGPQNSVIAGS